MNSATAVAPTLLTADTYQTGLIHDDERMAGVVALPTGDFAVFVTERRQLGIRKRKRGRGGERITPIADARGGC